MDAAPCGGGFPLRKAGVLTCGRRSSGGISQGGSTASKGRSMGMLEEKDLQAIAQLMQGMEDRIDQKLARQKREIMQEVGVLIENEVTPKFNLLAEGQEEILRRMPSEEDMDIIDGRLTALEASVRKLNREVAQLKKVQ